MMRIGKRGFTLVEIMIVVAIIGLLAAIAIPNFVKARTTALKNACIANLKQIQGAVERYALDTGATGLIDNPATDLVTGQYIQTWPSCAGTAYGDPTIGSDPTCPNGTSSPFDTHTI